MGGAFSVRGASHQVGAQSARGLAANQESPQWTVRRRLGEVLNWLGRHRPEPMSQGHMVGQPNHRILLRRRRNRS